MVLNVLPFRSHRKLVKIMYSQRFPIPHMCLCACVYVEQGSSGDFQIVDKKPVHSFMTM